MKRALVLIKPLPHYRRDAFEAGLKRLGFIIARHIDDPGPKDVLVTWNLTGSLEKEAQRFKRGGAKVIVTENGYLTPPGLPGMYAISLDAHNGAGRFPVGDSSRWEDLAIRCKPWRDSLAGHILVCGQRGIGSREMASPHGWHQKTAAKLQGVTRRPIVIRTHPGGRTSGVTPLEADLRNASSVVIWSSASGVKALVEGIPVHYAAPHWICSEAALPLHHPVDIEASLVDDASRLRALSRMAWGQWHYQEIATGIPLQRVLEC